MTASLRHAAGSLLIVGLSGAELTGLERSWLKLLRPGGIILFRRNIENARQARELLQQATSLCAAHSVRCVDVEGGSVDRLRDALAPMPSAQAVAVAARCGEYKMRPLTLSQGTRKDGAPSRSGLTREHGELIAQGAKAFGFNTTLAPVLDLALPESAAVLGTRAATATPDGVVEYARGFLSGLAAHSVVGCGKHFPGLGGGTLDSHLETPSIERSWRTLWNEDLVPYRALSKELPMVMVSHAAFPETRGKNRPASTSPFWITTVLRKQIGYRGIILSDDLEMGGILNSMPIEDAAVMAIRAGMDLLEICHSPELILRAYEALISEAERSAGFRALLLSRAKFVEHQRAKVFATPTSKALTTNQFETLRKKIFRFGELVAKAQPVAEVQSA